MEIVNHCSLKGDSLKARLFSFSVRRREFNHGRSFTFRMGGRFIVKFFAVVIFFAGLLASAVLAITLAGSTGAPQEAAGAAIALAIVAIPYCMGRAVQMWKESRRQMIIEDILTEIRLERERARGSV